MRCSEPEEEGRLWGGARAVPARGVSGVAAGAGAADPGSPCRCPDCVDTAECGMRLLVLWCGELPETYTSTPSRDPPRGFRASPALAASAGSTDENESLAPASSLPLSAWGRCRTPLGLQTGGLGRRMRRADAGLRRGLRAVSEGRGSLARSTLARCTCAVAPAPAGSCCPSPQPPGPWFSHPVHLQCSEHFNPAWKHSQYFFRQCDRLHRQPLRCTASPCPDAATALGSNAAGERDLIFRRASITSSMLDSRLRQSTQRQPVQNTLAAKQSQYSFRQRLRLQVHLLQLPAPLSGAGSWEPGPTTNMPPRCAPPPAPAPFPRALGNTGSGSPSGGGGGGTRDPEMISLRIGERLLVWLSFCSSGDETREVRCLRRLGGVSLSTFSLSPRLGV
mmetsp:Transcript_47694/g.91110  ORF Transcript_47694/g.91110 Transcript_47694/m.91110 type:complete len:392 (+) Transcript_47694:1918-3093(+)